MGTNSGEKTSQFILFHHDVSMLERYEPHLWSQFSHNKNYVKIMIDDSVATTKVLSIFVLSFMCWLFSKIITKSLQKFLSKKQIAPYLLNCHRLVVVAINSPSQEQNIVHLQNFSSYCLFVTPLLHLQKNFLLKKKIFFHFYPLLLLHGPHIFILFLFTSLFAFTDQIFSYFHQIFHLIFSVQLLPSSLRRIRSFEI